MGETFGQRCVRQTKTFSEIIEEPAVNKSRTLIIRNAQIEAMACAAIRSAVESVDDGMVVEVVIREHKSNRSLAQNRLAFRWYGELAGHLGTTPEYEHRLAKLRYGCPLLIADDAEFADFYRRGIEPLDYESRVIAMQWFPVSRLFSVKMMTQYLHDMEHDSAARGIVLSHPDDLYHEAMR